MKRLVPALVLVAVVAGGCSVLGLDGPGFGLGPREATRALADADAKILASDYAGALAAYDAFLARYGDDDRAAHVRIVRTALAELVALRAQLAALRERPPANEAEMSRLRQELTARSAEVARLKEDLETLKRTDLKMERRRR
jgi:hypothetical protein